MEQINTADVDDKDVLEGLFKENKEILEFLSSGLPKNGKKHAVTRSEEKLVGISEEKDSSDNASGKSTDKHSDDGSCFNWSLKTNLDWLPYF